MLLPGRGKKNHFEVIQSIMFLIRSALQRDCFAKTQPVGIVSVTNLTGGREIPNSSQLSLSMWENRNTRLQTIPAILSYLCWGEGIKTLVKFIAQRHRLTERRRPNCRTIDCFPCPPPHHHITKGSFVTVPFIWYFTSNYQEKITKHTKRQKFEETEQASEPDMTGMLESSDRQFKTQ